MRAMIEYSVSEMDKINLCFPNLYYERGAIRGEIDFSAEYRLSKRKKKEWKIESCSSGNGCIQDVYEIAIDLNHRPPKVFEVGGRIAKLARNLGKPIIDLHIYPEDESCCLGIFLPNERETLSDFVLKKVYPYFVWQAYFEKFGKIPPCGEFPHGDEGMKEFQKQVRDTGRNDPCPCGSGIKFKRCCSRRMKKLKFS